MMAILFFSQQPVAPEAFDSQGNYKNSSDAGFRSIGAYLAPDAAPPQARD
jgi:hypothetical protein